VEGRELWEDREQKYLFCGVVASKAGELGIAGLQRSGRWGLLGVAGGLLLGAWAGV
jgi:hypothetical protein